MSGWIVRVGAAVMAIATVSLGAMADPADAPPPLLLLPALEPAVPSVLTEPPVATAVGAEPAATTTAIPLPAGVYVGLVGLASAAIARRRYLRRH